MQLRMPCAWLRRAPNGRSMGRLSEDWPRCVPHGWKPRSRRFTSLQKNRTMTKSENISPIAATKVAFIFPGQGSQAVGMGKDLAQKYPVARQTFEEADAALGYKLSHLCFEGPEDQLRLTEVTQPAILTISIATLRVLESRAPKPSF